MGMFLHTAEVQHISACLLSLVHVSYYRFFSHLWLFIVVFCCSGKDVINSLVITPENLLLLL